jgi:hypothetical protein
MAIGTLPFVITIKDNDMARTKLVIFNNPNEGESISMKLDETNETKT